MSNLTNSKTPNPKNPSALKPRYEIRKLEPQHIDWASAIVNHSNCFHSPVWSVLYPDTVARVYKIVPALDYLIRHQITSGLSFGVFDTEYEYKTEAGKKASGKLLWDASEASRVAEQGQAAAAKTLCEQMDFPLVSVALSYDANSPLDLAQMKDLVSPELLPQFPLIYAALAAGDKRDPKSWEATGPGQVLMRNATSTRRDYEGEGIMAALARWLMREAAQRGYRGIQIEGVSDAVNHVWSKAEEPFKGTVVSEFRTEEYKDDEGKNPFAPAKQRVTKVYVDLKPAA